MASGPITSLEIEEGKLEAMTDFIFLDFKEIRLLILKEISPDYSLEGLMLKLKLQYFGHLMQRTDSLGKTLMLGKG